MKHGLSKQRFEEIYREGRRVQGELCRLCAAPGTGRIGFATPRAVGSIARRNRMKRRFRAAVMEMERPEHLDIVVAISARADQAPYPEIQRDLAASLKKITERWAEA